jgi:hypothetical protein
LRRTVHEDGDTTLPCLARGHVTNGNRLQISASCVAQMSHVKGCPSTLGPKWFMNKQHVSKAAAASQEEICGANFPRVVYYINHFPNLQTQEIRNARALQQNNFSHHACFSRRIQPRHTLTRAGRTEWGLFHAPLLLRQRHENLLLLQ